MIFVVFSFLTFDYYLICILYFNNIYYNQAVGRQFFVMRAHARRTADDLVPVAGQTPSEIPPQRRTRLEIPGQPMQLLSVACLEDHVCVQHDAILAGGREVHRHRMRPNGARNRHKGGKHHLISK